MALPHYKLQAPQQTFGLDSFPVVMVPNDGTVKTSYLKDLFFSRKTQALIAVISIVSIATALWIYFEPTTDLIPEKSSRSILIVSLATVAITLILLVIAAIYKLQSSDSFTSPPPTLSLLASREATTPSSIKGVVKAFEQRGQLASEQSNAVEFSCEEFVSEPFIEFLDESVIASVFSDEMIAPDCLVFSIEVKEDVTE